MKCILINNFINFTKSARTNVTTQDIKIQLTSIKYFTNKLEKLVIIAQKENAQVIIPKFDLQIPKSSENDSFRYLL